MNEFKRLLEPGRIGSIKLRNRIVYPSIGTDLGTHDGFVTEERKAYYEARAKGGAGLLIIEVTSIQHPRLKCMFAQLGISDDKFIPGLAELANVIHKHGAKAFVMLHSAGRKSRAVFSPEGYPPAGPSAVPIIGGDMPTELTLAEIEEIIQAYGQAAERAKKAGFDGVQLHGAHGYLINQFLSCDANKRQDRYGGTLKKRQRFMTEVIRSVRDKVGPDFPVIIRLDGREFGMEDGITISHGKSNAVAACAAGVDAIDVSGYGDAATVHFATAPIVSETGKLVGLAHGIKKVVDVPVIAVGRISPELGERVLAAGKADFIAMGRQLIADPETPNKIAAGKVEDIRRCIYCDVCTNQLFLLKPICCAINAAAGHETEYNIQRAQKPKRVVVIGGGPAGMEAARVAAVRGHRVILLEKRRWLGGYMTEAAILQPEFDDYIKYLSKQLRKLRVRVRLGAEATPETIEGLEPDVVVVACGAKPVAPEIPVVNGTRVLTTSDIWHSIEGQGRDGGRTSRSKSLRLLEESVSPHEAVVVVGADLVGLLLAKFWAEKGRRVFVVEAGKWPGRDMVTLLNWKTMRSLSERGASITTRALYDAVTDKGLTITGRDGESRLLEADVVVLSEASQPNLDLFKSLEGKMAEAYAIGDCNEKGLVEGAVAGANRVAMAI